jgi:hypothetical protein
MALRQRRSPLLAEAMDHSVATLAQTIRKSVGFDFSPVPRSYLIRVPALLVLPNFPICITQIFLSGLDG